MATRLLPNSLDLRHLAQSGDTVSGEGAMALFPRLAAEAADAEPRQVRWSARAEWRRAVAAPGMGAAQPPVLWLHLNASTELPLTCQRCLTPVTESLAVDRWFRFVADEATAAAEDEDSDEDVLVFEPAFNLSDLIEDELIMAQPLVPMHGQCPTVLPTSAGPVIEDGPAKPNPFAMLQQIKKA
jgi:uncharacterized protein